MVAVEDTHPPAVARDRRLRHSRVLAGSLGSVRLEQGHAEIGMILSARVDMKAMGARLHSRRETSRNLHGPVRHEPRVEKSGRASRVVLLWYRRTLLGVVAAMSMFRVVPPRRHPERV